MKRIDWPKARVWTRGTPEAPGIGTRGASKTRERPGRGRAVPRGQAVPGAPAPARTIRPLRFRERAERLLDDELHRRRPVAQPGAPPCGAIGQSHVEDPLLGERDPGGADLPDLQRPLGEMVAESARDEKPGRLRVGASIPAGEESREVGREEGPEGLHQPPHRLRHDVELDGFGPRRSIFAPPPVAAAIRSRIRRARTEDQKCVETGTESSSR